MTRIARGIYRDRFGYRVIWRSRGRPREKRFPMDTPIERLRKWREVKIGHARQQAGTDGGGSFVRDVATFLKRRRSKVSFKSDRSHLRPWMRLFRRLSTWAVTAAAVNAAVDQWATEGYSPRELRHRVRILRQFYRSLDPDSPTPADRVQLPTIQKTRPRSVSDDLVRSVALELRKHELAGWLRDAKTRARYLVDATCGQRPVQHMRATPDAVDLERRLWFVDPAKGDTGTVLWLNDEMLAAWSLFIAADAWGVYDRRGYARVLRRCGWPKGIRPYATRHSVGLSLSELGVDLGDIQQHMGHSDLNTTRRFYVPGLLARAKAASQKLEGRLGATTATPTAIFATTRSATNRENAPRSVSASLRLAAPAATIHRRKKA